MNWLHRIEFDYYPSFAAWPWAFGRNRNAAPRLQILWWLRVGPLEVRMWASKEKTMTDKEREHKRQVQELTQRIGELCQQVNAVTKQRDALLNVCRGLSPCDLEFGFGVIERLLEEMKDVVTVERVE